jgi:hypothetical protein
MMSPKVSRRALAALLLAPAAPAQEPKETLEQETRRRIEQTLADSKKLTAYAVPMDVEPAFQFRP